MPKANSIFPFCHILLYLDTWLQVIVPVGPSVGLPIGLAICNLFFRSSYVTAFMDPPLSYPVFFENWHVKFNLRKYAQKKMIRYEFCRLSMRAS